MATRSDLPSFGEYFPPAVEALKQRGGSATIYELEEDVSRLMDLSEEVLAIPHKGGPQSEFQYQLAWVRTYLKKAGLANNSERGVWSLTEAGERAAETELRLIPKSVRWTTRKPKSEVRQHKQDVGPESEETEAEPEELAREADWQERTLIELAKMEAGAFERLAQRILRESGFIRVEVTGRSGDGGIDGFGVLRINLVSFQVLFQCKRWKGSVGPNVVRDFRGAMVGRADKGLIITSGTFTADAKREATRDGAPAIDLVDGEALCHLLKDLGLGISVRQVEEVDIEPAFFRSI